MSIFALRLLFAEGMRNEVECEISALTDTHLSRF